MLCHALGRVVTKKAHERLTAAWAFFMRGFSGEAFQQKDLS